jgi:hypothetical protein
LIGLVIPATWILRNPSTSFALPSHFLRTSYTQLIVKSFRVAQQVSPQMNTDEMDSVVFSSTFYQKYPRSSPSSVVSDALARNAIIKYSTKRFLSIYPKNKGKFVFWVRAAEPHTQKTVHS